MAKKQHEVPFDQPPDSTTSQSSYLHAKQIIGGRSAPVNYSFTERVFSEHATPADKLAAKQEVVASLQSRILSDAKTDWNTSTSNYDNMQMTGKCYKRTNVNAERNRTGMYQYNFRAEKLPKKYPTIKPKPNRFNMGIIEVALREEYMGETFGDERMFKGISKRTEELPNHPDLRDAAPWNHSVELTPSTRKQHFLKIESEREQNSEQWKRKVQIKETYKNPEQLAKEKEEQLRQQKKALRASAAFPHGGAIVRR